MADPLPASSRAMQPAIYMVIRIWAALKTGALCSKSRRDRRGTPAAGCPCLRFCETWDSALRMRVPHFSRVLRKVGSTDLNSLGTFLIGGGPAPNEHVVQEDPMPMLFPTWNFITD